jgi:hypothetical protein
MRSTLSSAVDVQKDLTVLYSDPRTFRMCADRMNFDGTCDDVDCPFIVRPNRRHRAARVTETEQITTNR